MLFRLLLFVGSNHLIPLIYQYPPFTIQLMAPLTLSNFRGETIALTLTLLFSHRNRVISLGKPVTRLTVQGNDDSFHAAKQRMAEAEKDQRKCQSKAPYLTNTKRPGIRDATMNPRSVPTPPGSRIPDSRISPSLANVRSFSPLSANSYKSPVTSIADMSSRPIRYVIELATFDYSDECLTSVL